VVLRPETTTRPDGSTVTRPPEEASRDRGCDPAGLARRLAGDLDTIVAKALRKEPEHRYASVEQLSEDVRRHLAGLPVAARPDTLRYRAGKFVRRHRLGVAAAGGLAALMVGSGTVLAIQQQRLARERDRAESNARQMARERDKAQRTRDFLIGLFEVSDPGEARGGSISARELLDRGAQEVERELQAEPEVQADLMNTIGRVYRSLGLYEPAGQMLERALALRESLGRESLEVGESLNELGWLRWESGDYAAAERAYRDALALRRRLLGEEHPEVARSLNGLALVLQGRGDSAGAEPLFREVLAIRRRFLGEEHPDVAESLSNLALALRGQRKLADAEGHDREALAMRRKLLGDRHPDVGESLNNLARTLFEQGERAEAEALFRQALALFRELLGAEHPDLARSLNNLATVLQARGDYAGAEPLYRESLAMAAKLQGDRHPDVATALNNLALVLRAQGDLAGAEPLYRESLAISRASLGEAHPTVAIARLGLGVLCRDQGRYGEADRLIEPALASLGEHFGALHPLVGSALANLAELRRLAGRPREAEALARQAIAVYRETLAPEDRRQAVARSILGASLAGLGRFEEAEATLLASFTDLSGGDLGDDLYAREALRRLIGLYEAWGRPAEANRYRRLLAERSD
jgi:serine/threonine-protein kinase